MRPVLFLFLNISIQILINIHSINIHIFEKERITINTLLSFYLFAAPVFTWISLFFLTLNNIYCIEFSLCMLVKFIFLKCIYAISRPPSRPHILPVVLSQWYFLIYWLSMMFSHLDGSSLDGLNSTFSARIENCFRGVVQLTAVQHLRHHNNKIEPLPSYMELKSKFLLCQFTS